MKEKPRKAAKRPPVRLTPPYGRRSPKEDTTPPGFAWEGAVSAEWECARIVSNRIGSEIRRKNS